jgi:4-hydroxy-3-methylbut-2-enyl diphosphate reductase IspH
MKAGVNEKVAMAISGDRTRSIFVRHHIVDNTDVLKAMPKVQGRQSLEAIRGNSESGTY